MAVDSGSLLQCAFDEMGANQLLLVLGSLVPVLASQAESLDRGELTDSGILICKRDFDEKQKGLGLGVVVLLEVGRDSLDLLSVCCEESLLAICLQC